MKYVGCLLCLLVSNVFAWGASETFEFVSYLSSPVASFGTVETKTCGLAAQVQNVSLGCSESAGGTIAEKGDPFYIGNMKMMNNTVFKMETNKWFVNSLTVGKGGKVTAQYLVANTLEFKNNSQGTVRVGGDSPLTTDLAENGVLKVDNELSVKNLGVVKDLQVYICNDRTQAGEQPCFHFTAENEQEIGKDTASWKTVNSKSVVCGGCSN